MNKVILIGGNHHNILGAVRSFGVNKIYPFGIFIGEGAAKSFARSSKYWAQTWAIDSEENLIDFLLNHFENEKEKPVIICCSDASEKILDENYVNGDMEDGSGYDGADDGDSADDAEYDDSDYDDSDYEDSDDSYDDSNDMEVGE